MFLMSDQTLSPFLNRIKVFFCLSAILIANSCAANASSLSWIKLCICCSIDGYLVFSNVIGMVFGDSPCMSSKGEFSFLYVVDCCE